MAENKIRYTYDLVIAKEMSPEEVKVTGNDPIIEPNGKSFCPLAKMRASAVVEADVSETEAKRKAVRTACFYFKQENPEWADRHLHGLSPELVKSALVR